MESEELKKMVCFLYYQNDKEGFISINGFNFDLVDVKCGVPQGSILGPIIAFGNQMIRSTLPCRGY